MSILEGFLAQISDQRRLPTASSSQPQSRRGEDMGKEAQIKTRTSEEVVEQIKDEDARKQLTARLQFSKRNRQVAGIKGVLCSCYTGGQW